MGLTKLDMYDYVLLPGVIRISINGTNDPILVDVLSDINRSNGKIYIEGYYYDYLDKYDIYKHGNYQYMELKVSLTA
jgi:hypothetical protein